MTQESYLEQLPQAAVEVQHGKIVAMNTAARVQLPNLVPGDIAPEFLTLPLSGTEQTGSFAHQEDTFLFTRLNSPHRQILLFRPADGGLTSGQVSGFSRQMREQMAALLLQIELLQGQGGRTVTQLNHSFHQMLRLVNNLEFLNIPTAQAQTIFYPVTMDLAGLCRDLRRQAAPLLRKAKVDLQFVCSCPGLLIPGDPELLQRMILSLISNAAKASPGGRVTVELLPWMDKAILSVSDSNTQQVDLSTLLQKEDGYVPSPTEGAGMGMAVAQRIVDLHNGTLLSRTGEQGGVTFTVALPTGPLSGGLSLETPSFELDGGVSPFLLELSDLLPMELFEPEPN